MQCLFKKGILAPVRLWLTVEALAAKAAAVLLVQLPWAVELAAQAPHPPRFALAPAHGS